MAASEPTAPAAEVVTQEGDEYTSRGEVVLATRWGHAFVPSDPKLPLVTEHGVRFNRKQADGILDEAQRAGVEITESKFEKEG